MKFPRVSRVSQSHPRSQSAPADVPDAIPLLSSRILMENIGYILNRHPSSLDLNVSFLQHGGNSLSAVALASLCKRQGITLTVSTILRSSSLNELLRSSTFSEDQWRFRSIDKLCKKPFLRSLEESSQAETTIMVHNANTTLSPRTSSEIFLVDNRNGSDSAGSCLRRMETSVENPASYLQHLMLHDSVKELGTNVVRYYETYRPKDINVIKMAWNTLFNQEAILRASYSENLEPRSDSHFDWSEITTSDPIQFDDLVHAQVMRPEIRSTWKVVTLNIPEDSQFEVKSTVIWTIHHALIDGYSAKLLLVKLRTLAAGVPVSPGPPYAEIIEAIQALQYSQRLGGELFWHGQRDLYEKSVPNLHLPPPLDAQSSRGTGQYHIPVGTTSHVVRIISQECGVTPAAVFYSAWAVVLTILADSDQIAFGTAVFGRDLPLDGIEEVIGPLISTPPFAVSVNGGLPLKKFIFEVFNRITDLTEYQWTIPKHILRRGFQSAMFMGLDFDVPASDCPVRPIEPPFWKHDSAIPLTIVVNPEITCFQYRREDFSSASIENVSQLLDRTVRSFIRLDLPVRHFQGNLVMPKTHLTLLRNGNFFSASTSQLSVSDDLVTLFERVISHHPAAIAIRVGDQELSYTELDARVGIVSKALKGLTKKQDIVCVQADRSVSWIIGIFAVLKVGAVYCPLDPGLPEAMREFIIKQTSAKILICDNVESLPKATQSGFDHLLGVDSILSIAASFEGESFPHRAFPDPSASAYVCFTSGSTGTPKGVTCTHEGLVAFQSNLEVRLFAQPGTTISQIMSPAFDGSIHEIFSALCHGATLSLPTGDNIFEVLGTVESALITPSVADVLDPSDYPRLENVYFVGEPVRQSTNDRWAAMKTTYNMYGPTEGTCGATICRLQPGKPVTIGHPNPTTRLYILDTKGRNVPIGAVGEIHVAGIQVARGYLGLPEATATRFVRDPFCQEANERMFKTGDRGYWTDEGEIVCLGRNDRQIKLRGYRLDLDDLEIRASRAVEGIQSVAIVIRGDHLVAAVQPSTLDRNTVAAAFAKELPGYAQPRDIFLVDKFPTTRTGKLDYKEISSYRSQDFMQENDPLTSMEAEIARIWCEILELDDSKCITPTSNFLQLGGSSMLQMTLLVKLSSALGTRIPLRLVIDSHSLRELAARLKLLLDEAQSRNGSPILTTGPNKVSPLEKEWWSKYSLDLKPDTRCFNVSSVFRFAPDSLNLESMEMAWNMTLARYTIFKSRYVRVEGSEQEVERRYALDSPRVQLLQYADVEREANRMFDLESEPPIRVLLTNNQLIIVASHIVADIQTFKILFRDVKALYQGETISPPERAYELQPILKRDKTSCEFEFWSRYLTGVVFDKHEQPGSLLRKSFDGTSRLYRLSRELAKKIVRSPEEGYHLSLQQLAVAAVALVLEGDTEETDIVLGTPFTNRSTDTESDTVGLFLQPLPVRIQYSPRPSEADANPYLNEVRRTATAALAHAVPWHELLEQFHITPDYPNAPIFDVMVTFHTPDVAAKLDLPGLIPCFSWAEGSKFLLMTEFTALDTGDVVLRVEYDTDNYCSNDIDALVANVTTALWMLLSDLPSSAIKRAMWSGENGVAMATLDNDLMGRPWTMFQES